MSGTTFSWVGAASSDWTTPSNWQTGGSPATAAPNSSTDVALDIGGPEVDIPNATTITVASLTIGPDGRLVIGQHNPGTAALVSLGTILVESTNPLGGLVGVEDATVAAPTLTIAPGAIIGGGGTYTVASLVNNGTIQADGGFFGLGPVVVNGGTISGSGSIEVDHTSTFELGSATSQNILVKVDPTETATIILDNPGSFKGSLDLANPNSQLHLFFKGQTPTGATYDGKSLVITGAGGAVIDTIAIAGNAPVLFATPPSTLAGFGEVSIGIDPPPPGQFTWVGGVSSDWTTAANWDAGSVPNSGTDVVFDLGGPEVQIPNATTIIVGSLTIGPDGRLVIGQHNPGTAALVSLGTIAVASTNPLGGLVGVEDATVTAPTLTIAAGTIIGGGGTYTVADLVNDGLIQADGGVFNLGPVVVNGGTISGSGSIEVDHTSTFELGSATSQNILVNVDPTETATVILDDPGSYTGSLVLANPGSHLNLFFQGQTVARASYDGTSLTITGSDGVTIDTIPLASSGPEFLTLVGSGEVSIGPEAPTVLAPAALALAPASDSGTLGDNVTNVAMPTITGTGEVGAIVALFDGSTAFGTGTVAADGSWSITASDALAFGANTITATETDTGGNTSAASVPLGITLDTIASQTAFSGDGKSDVLWQNDDGSVGTWAFDGTSIVGWADVGNPGPAWHVKGGGDFDGDARSDILLQNDDGSVAMGMNGTSVLSPAVVYNPGPTWQVKGSGDFNGDGRSDILLQNDDGSVAVWDMNGSSVVDWAVVYNPGTAWHVKGSGDFNGDGRSDILLQNDDGSVATWNMDGTAIVDWAVVHNPGPDWQVKGSGDFNGDGKSDIVLQNSDGSVAVWDMDGSSVIDWAVVYNPGTAWHVKGSSDINGDGRSDILLQNDDGSVATWDMNGTSIADWAVMGNPGSAWHAIDGDNLHFIYDTSGTGTLTGTSQADEFVLTSLAPGANVISGFDPTQDIVALSRAQFAAFADVLAHTTDSGGGALIDLGNSSGSLLLQGVSPGSLHANNFALS